MTATLILGDCMDFMKGLPDNAFSLALIDPPYGIGADNFKNGQGSKAQKGNATAPRTKNRLNQGGGKLKNRVLNKSNCSWDIAPDQTYFEELFIVSSEQIIWGGNYFNLPPSRGFVIWDKLQPWPNFSRCEYAWVSKDTPSKLFQFGNRGFMDKHERTHPTEKPIKLYEFLLANYAKEGATILDTHGGSMSSVIACINLGFDITCIEKDADYFAAAKQRIENHQRQPKMFDMPLTTSEQGSLLRANQERNP